ncbi:MAG: hypothetical protein HZB99_03655 [Candidatus Harrisonbacteria bacterium]|nr:hypothetical protein [Candidatus Harrisonbacteria bacterium]
MKLAIPKLNISVQNFLRQCGYQEISNPHKDNEISHARSLDSGRFYPRFHIYFEENKTQTIIDLHLDAKKPSYEGFTAHSGEYEGAVVEQEAKRIKKISEKSIPQKLAGKIGFPKTKSLLQKLKDCF